MACAISASAAWTTGARAEETPRWRDEWPRFRSWEYGLTAGAAVGAFTARFVIPHPPATWRGGILFDDAVRDALAIRHEPTRVAMSIVSHVMTVTPVVYRLVDSTVVPGEVHDDWDLAEQMMLIDAESYAVTAAVLYGTQIFVGRERPIVRRCGERAVAESERVCDPADSQRNRSFINGHTALGSTAAGLTCAHHGKIPLYGGGAADTFACVASLSWAAAIGVVRIVSDNHYTTDTVLGVAVGLASGWALPMALHYAADGDTQQPGTTAQRLRSAAPPPMFAYGAAF